MKKVLKTIFRFLTGEFVHREVDRYIEEMITYDEFKLQLKNLKKNLSLYIKTLDLKVVLWNIS